MNVGQIVRLRTYGNKEVAMRLLRQDKETLIVCQPEEYERAINEKREPRSVGFHKKYLIS